MARGSAIPPETFEEILAWLNPDRDVAGAMYVQLRHDLEKVFIWGGCPDPEGLADEVLDRVAKKIYEVKPSYVGDPRLYFLAVARNLVKENFRKIKTHVSLTEIELSEQLTTEGKEDDAVINDCLDECLQKLSSEQRELVAAYYAKEKQAKIAHRSALAQRLAITVETLRVRVFRLRASLEDCIERCVERKSQLK
jgi:RNA polymerase sigma factor (sigma-70 family)